MTAGHEVLILTDVISIPAYLTLQGTSVTAGHDNFFNQSYPIVWGRLMNRSAKQSITRRSHHLHLE